MTSYTVNLIGPPSNAQATDPPGAAEDREAADSFDGWISWLDDVRSAIEAGGCDAEDLDSLLANILQFVADESAAAVEAAEKRAAKFANDVLRRADDSNAKIAVVLRQQRQAHEAKRAEAQALAGRLDRIADAITVRDKKIDELEAKVVAIETELAKATGLLEREIAKERSLRRLLDARRDRPRTQKIASELARNYAKKALESATKGKPEVSIQ